MSNDAYVIPRLKHGKIYAMIHLSSLCLLLWTQYSSICTVRLFFATGISISMCSNACALALRKFCEEATIVMFEPSDLEILIWIGEVCYFP